MKYYIEEYDETELEAREMRDNCELHDRFTASRAAEEFHNHHDGWEANWPLTFVLVNETGTSRWVVDRVSVPEFYATKMKE